MIITDIHGCVKTVEPGKTGFLCRVRDAQSLYEQMKYMAELPREQRRQMGLAVQQRIELHFSKKIVVCGTLEAIF